MSERSQDRLPLVAIVGRPNVGKSALFNRLIGRRRSIVTDEPGITRDRLYGRAEWCGREFEVVDTGGIVTGEAEHLPAEIVRQAKVAIDAAECVVLVVDGRVGATPLDEELARLLQRTGKPLLLAVNKIDSPKQYAEIHAFHHLGIRAVLAVSAEHSLGIDDLLDQLTRDFPMRAVGEEPERALGIAIIGRPNVGKSTLLNRLVGEERVIVSPEPGTTRDAVDSYVRHEGRLYCFVDTAGIRRKGKTKLLAEKLSVIMARKHLERSDVALLLLEAATGVTKLDAAIAGYAHSSGRSVILVVNKWDSVTERSDRAAQALRQRIADRLKFLDYAPVVFISALTGHGLPKLYRLIEQVAEARARRIPTGELNRFLESVDLARGTMPASKKIRIYYMTQAETAPPTFVLFTNQRRKLHFSYERFLENQIRARFEFLGTPIRFKQRLSRPKESSE